LRKHEAVLLSGSIRSVNPDHIKLSYATSHRLSVVLYLSQHVDPAGVEDMASLTRTLIDLALAHGGTFYLPYQQHYTRAQLEAGYPQIDEFFAMKRSYDPSCQTPSTAVRQEMTAEQWTDTHARKAVPRGDTGTAQQPNSRKRRTGEEGRACSITEFSPRRVAAAA
jgi:hypothetical protein